MTDCCTFGCDQSPGCIARVTANSPHYCDKSRQICPTPYTCSDACALITDNSDGSSRDKPANRLNHLGRWALLTLAVMAAAAVTAGFFTK